MQSNRWLLVRMLLRASGNANILKYEKDRKKRGKIIGSYFGSVILYAFAAAFCILVTYGFGMFGMIQATPGLCAMLLCVVELIFSILRAGSELFSRKDYELLTALPFTARELVSAKFIAMYIRNLPLPAVCSLSLMVGYGLFAHPAFPVYIIWIVLTFFLPLIPTVVASAIGVVSTGAGAGFKHKTMIQSIVTFAFITFFVFFGQIAGRMINTAEQANAALQTISNVSGTAGSVYPPVKWFSDAVLYCDPVSILLLIVVSTAVFELVFYLISKAWCRIHSRLMSVKAEKRWKMTEQKTRSVIGTISFKEYRRFVGSTLYLTNAGFGQILVVILSVLVLFLDVNVILQFMAKGAPIQPHHLLPAIPNALFFFLGMCPTTVVSYSLEGKNYWILQSLPVTKKEIFLGKMRFNLWTVIPFMLFGSICFGIAFHAGPVNILLYILCGTILCLYATALGMHCNIRHLNMSWEKEVEAIKQGTAVLFYILPHVFISMAVCGVSIFLGHMIGTAPTLLLISAVYAALALLFYHLVMKEAKKSEGTAV